MITSVFVCCGRQTPKQAVSTPTTPRPSQVRVTAVMAREAKPVMSLCIENLDRQDMTLMAGTLPWASRYSLFLIATAASSGGTEVLTQPLVVSDPVRQLVTIAPGERRCGEIDLAKRLPGFAEMNARSDILVFWAYRHRDPAGDTSGGVMVVPKRAGG
jgi:hypothetical protein